MVAAPLRSEMIFKCLVGMACCNPGECRVPAEFRRLEKNLKVHHIVYDDGALPSSFRLPSPVHIPRLEYPGGRPEPCRQGFRRIDADILVAIDILEPESVAVTVIYHETYIMVPCEVLYVLKGFRVLSCVFCPEFVAGEFIHVPEGPGEEAAHPVRCRHEYHFPFLE